MSSRDLRSATKRKSEDINGLDSASQSSTSQPSKRSKTSNTTQKPQGRSKAKSDENKSNAMKASKQNMSSPKESTHPTTHDPSEPSNQTLTLTESTGDIFSAPSNTLLIHACNTEGSWGAGIAAAFKSYYPSAYEIYHDYCHMNGGELWHKALLIPPQPDDQNEHFVGCLFTSRSKGRKKDSPAQILKATEPAMKDLMRQVRKYDGTAKVEEVRMCKINSGLFAVKWEKTKAVLESIEIDEEDFHEIKVISREE